MPTIFAKTALLEEGWASDVRLTLQGGKITTIKQAASAKPEDITVSTLLPALANLHSHSFQRAMAGMTEFRTKGQDSFWTWRDLMYRFTRHITPEQVEAIAALAFMEMQEAGFASVGEFHYLHHQPGGQPYAALAELSNSVFAAAQTTGIGLTHLPVLYSYGGAGMAALAGGQARFGNNVEQYNRLVSAVQDSAKHLPADTRIGIAPHSLRATSPADLSALLAAHPSGPVHIHIAEQPKEVADISAWLGARPVEWLLDNAPVNPRWCLIHTTHMSHAETKALAKSGAVAGLCPITEANLGDGPFNGPTYLKHGGRFGIGSDSNIRISLTEELRTLEYSQRLRDGTRNVLAGESGSVGQTLYLGAARGGAQALGRASGSLRIGALADLVAINREADSLCALPNHQLLDGLAFAADSSIITDLWSAGRHCVQNGHHVARAQISAKYRIAISGLMAAL
ncbi:MAG: formimidoylglutamate deiminase [Rhodobacteraceae bacterium]|nr:formimidoylglutamate deiminase [Paracoccaceae bacterium]